MALVRRGRREHLRTLRAILVAATAVGMTVVIIAGWALWSARQDARRNAATAARNVALSVARGVESSVALYDRSLSAVARTMAAPPSGSPADVQAVLDRLDTAPDLGTISVTDAAGRIIATTGASGAMAGGALKPPEAVLTPVALAPPAPVVADRDFFLIPRDHADAGLFVSQPFRQGGDGAWSIAFARRLTRPDGRFDGIVVSMLPLSRLSDLTDNLDIGPRGMVTLLRQDGVVIAHAQKAVADDVRRLFSYSGVGTLPLVVTVAMSLDDVFAAWWREAAVIGSVTVTLLATLAFGTGALRRELKRRIAAEAAACRSAAYYRLLAENSSDIILRLDRDGRQLYASPSIADLLGYEPLVLIGQDWRLLADPEDRPALAASLATLAGQERALVQYRCRHRNGQTLWVEASLRRVRDEADPAGAANGAIVNIRDVTWRKQAEEKLAVAAERLTILASTDALTALANRRIFDETLQLEWRRACRGMTHLALLMIDVDSFKSYNDQYGHQMGDAALQTISACIAGAIKRPADLAARYGGEEFAVLLPDVGVAGAMSVANDIRLRLAARAVPHAGTQSGVLTVSIGIASLIAQSDREPAQLVADADAALYAAKRAGRDRIVTHAITVMASAAD